MSPNMDLFEPITYENIRELKPGEWIWDSKTISRREHSRTLWPEAIEEPIGFRQIHILDRKDFPRFSSKPFMLSDIDSSHGGYTWTYFELGRFYKFRKEKTK